MKIAFTICSNNYLAQASVLIESFKKFHPDFYFAVGLVDVMSAAVDYAAIQADEILPIADLTQYKVQELFDKYNIVELNTAVKPFVFQYYIEKFTDVEVLYYFDPDLKFFADINYVTQQLETASIVLTPHIMEPIPRDGKVLNDQEFLNYGLYNLGFLGLNPRHPDAPALLAWWGDRTFHLGYDRVAQGLFVDQLWMNLAPLFYQDVVILRDNGLNMGPWNLHERRLAAIDPNTGRVLLTNGDQLRFYHFSSFRFKTPDYLSHSDRFTMADMGPLQRLYNDYLADVLLHHIEKYSQIKCVYIKPPAQVVGKALLKRKIRNALKLIASKVLD
ncbi:MAG: hypothetical protein EOO63_00160 [Hymenobacter sp.]|nr:MAG: hypothetical protein EOO63_00160 [Hymenobacter sp.]